VLFFFERGARRVHVAGCTTNPDFRWTTEQARKLAWSTLDVFIVRSVEAVSAS
jgi:hypothetical protein